MIKLIIFDFDGTLGDTRRNIVTTMQMTIAELGLSGRTDDECASKIGLPRQPWGQAPGACGINSNLPEKFGSMNKKAYLCA